MLSPRFAGEDDEDDGRFEFRTAATPTPPTLTPPSTATARRRERAAASAISDISDTEPDRADVSDREPAEAAASRRRAEQLRQLREDEGAPPPPRPPPSPSDLPSPPSSLLHPVSEIEPETEWEDAAGARRERGGGEDGEDAGPATDDDGGGYGTAMDTMPDRSVKGLRKALEEAELRLEESGWEKEALEVRIMEAEAALANAEKNGESGKMSSRLEAEIAQNAYLRRLLDRAEQTRNAARSEAKIARVRLAAREREIEDFARKTDRAYDELNGVKRRLKTETTRSRSVASELARTRTDLEDVESRHLTQTQWVGMLATLAFTLALRIFFGPRVGWGGGGRWTGPR